MIRLVNSWSYKSNLDTLVLEALIDDYYWFITSKNLLEFKIKRKLSNTEAMIIALEKWATRSTYV